jgi:hypothetical protein
MHGFLQFFDVFQRSSRIRRMRTTGLTGKFVALSPQPLHDICEALASDPLGPTQAAMTQARDLLRREVWAIKNLSQRIPLHGWQRAYRCLGTVGCGNDESTLTIWHLMAAPREKQ